jgi:hypothetical protein
MDITDLITPEDQALFRTRFKGEQCEASLRYAKREAGNYAKQHANEMPAWVQLGVAALMFRYLYVGDSGDKALLRRGIDALLGAGRKAKEARQ